MQVHSELTFLGTALCLCTTYMYLNVIYVCVVHVQYTWCLSLVSLPHSQEYDSNERSIHEYSLRGMYRDGALLLPSSFLTKEWWVSRRFFWERGLNEIPHCVVFVFDGSSDPFLDPESLEFFQTVFKDCTELGMF